MIRIGVPKELDPTERRVALIPAALPPLIKAGCEIAVEAGAGNAAGQADASYESKGARRIDSRDELFATAEIILQVRGLGANAVSGRADLPRLRAEHVLIGFHPFFIMKTGMPTHFTPPDSEPVAIQTHVHLLSDHVRAAMSAGWKLAELREQVIDERWVEKKPSWAVHRGTPISFAFVWSR